MSGADDEMVAGLASAAVLFASWGSNPLAHVRPVGRPTIHDHLAGTGRLFVPRPREESYLSGSGRGLWGLFELDDVTVDRVTLVLRPDPSLLRPGNQSLTGIFFGAELAIHHDRVHPMVQRHLDDVASGALEIVIDSRFPLAEAAAAHTHIENRQAFGRVLLIP